MFILKRFDYKFVKMLQVNPEFMQARLNLYKMTCKYYTPGKLVTFTVYGFSNVFIKFRCTTKKTRKDIQQNVISCQYGIG